MDTNFRVTRRGFLAGLGLAAVSQERRTGELSGGQRARLPLAEL